MAVVCKGFNGVLLADKTGEIGFINDNNVPSIPKLEDVKEDAEYEDQKYYKTVYGHQETVLGMRFNKDRNLIASWDTLKKVIVVGWPNVFDHRSQLLEHENAIQACCFFGSQIASISAPSSKTE